MKLICVYTYTMKSKLIIIYCFAGAIASPHRGTQCSIVADTLVIRVVKG